MAVILESVSTTTFASGTTLTITKPTGLAVGDLMILHYTLTGAGDTILNETDWTHEVDNYQVGTGDVKTGVMWKIATSGDVAASNFVFDVGNSSAPVGGAIMRISGAANVGLLNEVVDDSNNTDTPTFTNSVTPISINNLLIFLVASADIDGTATTTNYAIANDNPTWTESYDFDSSTTMKMAMAYAYRSQATATGDSSCTTGPGGAPTPDNVGIMIAIPPIVNISVSPAVISTATSMLAPTVTGGANVTASVITANTAVQAPTVSTPDATWTNTSKNASSWTNQSKS
jgi:hypothetical protein